MHFILKIQFYLIKVVNTTFYNLFILSRNICKMFYHFKLYTVLMISFNYLYKQIYKNYNFLILNYGE